MSVTFNLTNILSALVIFGSLLVFAHQVGKWTQTVNGMLKELKDYAIRNQDEILSLRKSRHEHGDAILELKMGLEGAQEDIGELLQRRSSDKKK